MKHTTGKIYLILFFPLALLISCQTKDPWQKTFSIEKYMTDFAELSTKKGLDTFDLHAFEDYLLQHPINGQGKTFKDLFLESDSFRTVHRSKLIQAYLKDTLRFRWQNHLVPNAVDSPRQDVDFKVFLINLNNPVITNLTLMFPEGAYRDSVWVDSLAFLDSLHLAPRDSIVLYTYRVHYDRGSYRVGSSELKEPLYASQISPPAFSVQDIQWEGQGKPLETILPCEKNEVKLLLENGKPAEFTLKKETPIQISVPCFERECLVTAEASGATIRREKSKLNNWLLVIKPEENEFSISVYANCLPGYIIQSGKEKKSIAGKNLVQKLILKAKN